MNTSPLVSIIIPTKNSGNVLDRCLRSVKNQSYNQIEIIVVDNGSTDDTKKIAKSYKAKVFNKGPERGAQKNLGAKKARGEAICFIDSDMELTRDVILSCVKVLKRCDAIMIPEKSIGEGFWNKCVILERSCYIGDDHTEAARFFRKSVFEKIGGFDQSLVASGDDMDLSQRIRRSGYAIGRVKPLILHYEGYRSPLSTFKKWRYYGRDMGRYVRKNKKEALYQYLPLRPAWIKNWRKLIKDPIHTGGFIFLKFCQFMGVVFGQIDAKSKSRTKLSYNPYSTSSHLKG